MYAHGLIMPLLCVTAVALITIFVEAMLVAQKVPVIARFEVASIRPVVRDSRSVSANPIRITATGQLIGRTALRYIIHLAYGAEPYEKTVGANAGVSASLEEVFDVNALPPESSSPPTREEAKAMARQMLAERFGMKVRIDNELVSATVLRLIKPGVLGRGLRPASEGCSQITPDAKPSDPKFAEALRRSCVLTMFDGRIRGIATLDQFASQVSFIANRPILNRTGLEGPFAFDAAVDMTSLFLSAPLGLGGRASPAGGQSDAPAFVDALREQMGLSARTERQPIRLFVVEHVGPLVEN